MCCEYASVVWRNGGAVPSSEILGASPYCSDPSSCLGSGRTRKGVAKGRIVWELSHPKTAFQCEKLGSRRKCRWHRSKLLKQRGFRGKREVKTCCFFWGLKLTAEERQREDRLLKKRGVSTKYSTLGKFDLFMRSMFLRRYASYQHVFKYSTDKCTTFAAWRKTLRTRTLLYLEEAVIQKLDYYFMLLTALIAAFVLFFFRLLTRINFATIFPNHKSPSFG